MITEEDTCITSRSVIKINWNYKLNWLTFRLASFFSIDLVAQIVELPVSELETHKLR